MENAPKDVGVIVAWKDGLISSAIGKEEKGKKSFEEKAREKSISIGMDHRMALLGELHKNESNSCSCVPEREPELLNSSKTLPPTTKEQSPPTAPHPRSWSIENPDQDV